MQGYSVEIHRSLEKIRKEYRRFQEQIGSRAISSSYEWISLWHETFEHREDNRFGNNKELVVCFLYRESELIAIAPFVILSKTYFKVKIRSIEFIGQQWGATYCDILSSQISNHELNLIIDKLKQSYKFDVLFLTHIPQFSNSFSPNCLFPYEVCPEIKLQRFQDYNDYRNQCYSKSTKQNLRSALNRANKNNHQISITHEAFDTLKFKEIVNAARSKIRDGKADKYSDPLKVCFRKRIMNLLESNVTTIRIDEKLCAYRINIVYRNTKFCFDASYDRDFPKYNLGPQSVDASINNSYDLNLNNHCEGPGNDYYKRKFATHLVTLNYYTRAGNTLKGKFLAPFTKFVLQRKSNQFSKRLCNENQKKKHI